MTKNNLSGANPFAMRNIKQLSRRAFSKGVFSSGIALAAAPIVLPNVLNATTMVSLPTASPLREVIVAHLTNFDGQASLESVAQNEDFHNYLGRELIDLHPASTN